MSLAARRCGTSLLLACVAFALPNAAVPQARRAIAATKTISVCTSKITINFTEGSLDLSNEIVEAWIQRAAESVATYFGQFPVPAAEISVVPVSGRSGIVSGTTWGTPEPHTRMRLGQHTTQAQLDDDWVMTHELVHMALAELADEHHWLEEGLATYLEPIARVQHGVLSESSVWADMMRDMPQGQPQAGDQGLDHTHTWARTYWGGAMFYLVADVTIRQRTNNRKGLQDALQAIVRAGKNISVDSTPEEVLAIGDRATGADVLVPLYKNVSSKPVTQDLDSMWVSLGVQRDRSGVRFNDKAPLAAIRRAIFQPRPTCSAR